jgi:putative peptidoglycan lipid II flippase
VNKLLKRANRRVSLGGAAALLISVALMGQILGFMRNRLVSTNFTVIDPGSSDAFFAAFQIPDFFFYTIAAGALGVAFMPILSDRLHKGDKESIWLLTSSLLTILAAIMAVVAVIIFVFAAPLIHLLTPRLEGEHFNDAVNIMRLIALNPLLFTLSGILTSVQQTFGRFFFYAIAPLTYNLSIIASIYLFKDNLGIIGLGVGALAGAVIQLLVAMLGLFGLGFRFRPIIAWRNKHFRDILRQLPPRSIDQGIDSINSIVETNRAHLLGAGAVSYYNFALTLHYVPISLIGTSISTAAFPRLAERLSQNRPDLFRSDFLKILRTMIWITMPVVVISYFCRGYLARLLFGDVAPEVALIFGYLTIAILFRIIYSIISRYFYAQKDTRTPLFVSIFAIALNIVLAFNLARPQDAGGYGIAGLALAQSLVAVSEVLILFSVMLFHDHKLFNREFWGGGLRILSVTGFSILTAFIMISLLPLRLTDTGLITLGSKLSVIALVTILVHVSVSAIFGLEEVSPVWRKFRQLVLKPIRIQ